MALCALLLLTGVLSCASLKTSRPIVPMREYEKMLVGSMFADYVGNEKCLEGCHDHDRISAFLEDSVHGQQVVEGTEMPLVNCETCHGPGSEAIEASFIQKNARCDTSKFIKPDELPAGARSTLCLKCHSSYSMADMQAWPFSEHSMGEVSCSDCHKLHLSSRQTLEGEEINQLCLDCHDEVRARFSFRSRHPVPEGKMLCVDCHSPHGSQAEKGIKAMDQKGLCINCHGQLAGPYTFEHADVTDECTTCHNPHGSVFAGMLSYQEPYLCLQCHGGHTDITDPGNPSAGIKAAMYTRCSNCHTQVHGTDTRGPHPGSGLIQ
jgi:DmsE family decaheme c-type cytochrome